MQTFTTQKTITNLRRQVYVGDKSAYQIVGSTPFNTCYLRPLNEEQSASNGVQFGLGFSIIVEVDVDLREGDKVTIDSVEYTLRGIVNHDRGGATKYKKALALKPENQ